MTETLDPRVAEALSPPKQDLHETRPIAPDPGVPGWAAPRANAGRLAKASEWVTAINTDPRQTHVIIDRYSVGQEILPGQSKRFEMLVSDIAYFLRQRAPHSVTRVVDNEVKTIILQHPIDLRDGSGSPFLNAERFESIAEAEDAAAFELSRKLEMADAVEAVKAKQAAVEQPKVSRYRK